MNSPRPTNQAAVLVNPRIARKRSGKSRLVQSLSTTQFKALLKWFLAEEVTYAEAIKRLEKQFKITTTKNCLSKFWRAYVGPRIISANIPAPPGPPVAAPLLDAGPVLFEIVIQVRQASPASAPGNALSITLPPAPNPSAQTPANT